MQALNDRFKVGISGLTLLAFALPFLTISCGGAEMSFSGLDLATGTTIEGKHLDSAPAALAALACAVITVIASISSSVSRPRIGLREVSSAAGAVLLVVLRFSLAANFPREARGMLEVSYEGGYWLAMVGFIFSFVIARASQPVEASQEATVHSTVADADLDGVVGGTAGARAIDY